MADLRVTPWPLLVPRHPPTISQCTVATRIPLSASRAPVTPSDGFRISPYKQGPASSLACSPQDQRRPCWGHGSSPAGATPSDSLGNALKQHLAGGPGDISVYHAYSHRRPSLAYNLTGTGTRQPAAISPERTYSTWDDSPRKGLGRLVRCEAGVSPRDISVLLSGDGFGGKHLKGDKPGRAPLWPT